MNSAACRAFREQVFREVAGEGGADRRETSRHAAGCAACAAFASRQAGIAGGLAELRVALGRFRAPREFDPRTVLKPARRTSTLLQCARPVLTSAASLAAVWVLFLWNPRTFVDRSHGAWVAGRSGQLASDEHAGADASRQPGEVEHFAAVMPQIVRVATLHVPVSAESAALAVPRLAWWSSDDDGSPGSTPGIEGSVADEWSFQPVNGPSLILPGAYTHEWNTLEPTAKPGRPSDEETRAVEQGGARGDRGRGDPGILG